MKLKSGLSVHFERSINGIDSHKLTISKIKDELITGLIEFSDIEITIIKSEVLRVIGNLDWNIQNLKTRPILKEKVEQVNMKSNVNN